MSLHSQDNRTILGFDPGLARVGYGVVHIQHAKPSCVTYGCITTSPEQTMGERLLRIFAAITDLLDKFKPSVVAIEKLYFATNSKTAMDVGHARGVILLALAQKGATLCEYTPLQVKQAVTGYGKAEKRQIQKMVRILLRLPQIPKPDDAADALAIALCASNSITH